MRTVEAALGLLIIAASVALAFGAGRLVGPIPAAGLGLTIFLAGLGGTIAAHGISGRAWQKHNLKSEQTWRAVFYLLLGTTLAAGLPLCVDLMNLASVAGFPLGYYMAAQGLLILMAILSFRAAKHLDALDEATVSAQLREDE